MGKLKSVRNRINKGFTGTGLKIPKSEKRKNPCFWEEKLYFWERTLRFWEGKNSLFFCKKCECNLWDFQEQNNPFLGSIILFFGEWRSLFGRKSALSGKIAFIFGKKDSFLGKSLHFWEKNIPFWERRSTMRKKNYKGRCEKVSGGLWINSFTQRTQRFRF